MERALFYLAALIHNPALEDLHEMANADNPLSATYLGKGRCNFLMWSPKAQNVELNLLDPKDQHIVTEQKECGYHETELTK